MLGQILLLLLFMTSCALFNKENPTSHPVVELMTSIKGTGEGRGRLSLDQQQYVFSYEAVLKENTDWLFAATFPLHGEEVMVLSRLKDKEAEMPDETFANRIEAGIENYLQKKNESPLLAKQFFRELRLLMKFVLQKPLKLETQCKGNSQAAQCTLDGETYDILVDRKGLQIKKMMTSGYILELRAQNLTESIFMRTQVLLHSQKLTSKEKNLLSLELFWK
jgi:hypothetical protein